MSGASVETAPEAVGAMGGELRLARDGWGWRLRVAANGRYELPPALVAQRTLHQRTQPRSSAMRALSPRRLAARTAAARLPLSPPGATTDRATVAAETLLRRLAGVVWSRLRGTAAVWIVSCGRLTRLWWRDVVEPKQPSEGT
jgi:hypothetical protein